MKSSKVLIPILAALVLTGCGDPVMQRELGIRQIGLLDDGKANDVFDIDTTQIPSDWVEQKSLTNTRYGVRTNIELAPNHRVKVVLLPM